VAWIDGQHQKMLDRIIKLLNAILQEKSASEVGYTMKFLQNYVVGHFSTEEKYMQEYDYPETQNHKLQHVSFIKTFKDFQKEYGKTGATKNFAIRIECELWEWYKNHISSSDKKFGEFLKIKNAPDTTALVTEWTHELQELLDRFSLEPSKQQQLEMIKNAQILLNNIKTRLDRV
jgi:hemerythrin